MNSTFSLFKYLILDGTILAAIVDADARQDLLDSENTSQDFFTILRLAEDTNDVSSIARVMLKEY